MIFHENIILGADRIALVMGNANYEDGPLNSPVNDAEDLARILRNLGFEVNLARNQNQREMEKSIQNFANQLRDKEIGLFYYSGHGIQVGEFNYLLPIKHRIESPVDVKYNSVNAQVILDKMESAGSVVNIIILDACRDNPLKSLSKSLFGSNKGLKTMEAPQGSFVIAYATRPGGVAIDGTGRNSIYTKYLLKHIKSEELELKQILQNVAKDVNNETNQGQRPWFHSSLIDDFYFTLIIPPRKIRGLIARYKFDGDVSDISRYQNNGERFGASFDFDRKNRPNRSLRFDGINDFVRTVDKLEINEHSICAWIKHDGKENMVLNQRIVGKVKPYKFESYTLGITDDFRLMTNFATGNEVNHLLVGKQRLAPKRWYHVAMTYDGFRVNFYVNGKLDESHQRSGVVRTNSNYLAIGLHCADNNEKCYIRGFDGVIDDVRIYNRGLKSDEIKRIVESE